MAALLEWKEALIAAHASISVNAKIAAANGLLSHLDRRELRLRPPRAGVSTPGRLAGWDWWSHNLGSVVCTAETGRLAVCITFYFFCNGCTITLTDNVTVKAKYAAVYGVGYTTIEVFNSVVEGEYAIYGAGPTNKVTLRGAKVTGSKFGIYQGPYDPNYFLNEDVAGSVYEIYSSTIKGGDDYAGVCINNYITNVATGNHTLLVEDSQITGGSGIETKRTNVTIKGEDTVITATGTTEEMHPGYSPVSSGYAVAAAYYQSEAGAMGTLKIEGGTFVGAIGIQEPVETGTEPTSPATLTISGGKFTDDVSEYVVDDMMQDKEGNIVKKTLVTSVTLDKTVLSLTVGGSETLTATVKPDNATDKDVTWTSNNETVATVENGKVTAVAVGTATITAKAGEKEASCTVTVTEPIKYTVTVSASPAEGGAVSGGGTYTEETEVAVTATAKEGYHFVRWVDGNAAVSPDPSYTFIITANRTLTAVFEENEIPHQHTYDEDAWAFNAAGHWQQCSDAACPDLEGSKTEYAEHSYDDEMDTICNVCGYVRMVTPPEPETYTVTILNGGFGAEGVGSYREGDRVDLYAGRRTHYEFVGWWSADVTLEDADSVHTSFIMPDYPVVVEALWYKEDRAPSVTLPTHDIAVDGVSHGDVEVWPEEAKMTTTVTITAPAGWVNPYTDVAVTAWYYDAVGYASANGIMGGTSATTFAPESTMNRSMVWTVIARLAGQTITGTTWAEDAKAWAMAQSVSDGTNPDGNVTREELVTMLYRYAGSPEMNVPELGLINGYPDSADISDWAQNAFAWALSTGVIDGRDGKLAAGESVTRAEAATILARFHMLSK